VGPGFGVAPSDGPVDWEGDGAATNMHARVDIIARWWESLGLQCPTGMYQTLPGGDDWADLLPPAQADAEAKQAAEASRVQGGVAALESDEAVTAETSRRRSPSSGPELSMDEAREKHVLHTPERVPMTVSPGCALPEKPVAPGNPGQISVAILGSPQLDVSQIEPSSLRMHRAAATGTRIADVNGDGIPDLLATFDLFSMRLNPAATHARVTGWMKDSRAIFGEDRITVLANLAGVPLSCQ